jgi:hypothetical protein
VRDASLTNLGGEHRAKPVPPEPTVSWLMSIPRSASLRQSRGGSNQTQVTRLGTAEVRWPRIYRMLRAAGHDPTNAAEILLDAQRKDNHAGVDQGGARL